MNNNGELLNKQSVAVAANAQSDTEGNSVAEDNARMQVFDGSGNSHGNATDCNLSDGGESATLRAESTANVGRVLQMSDLPSNGNEAKADVSSLAMKSPQPNQTDPKVTGTRKRHWTVSETTSTAAAEQDDDDDGTICSICNAPWQTSGEHQLVSLKCGHLFGRKCVERWLQRKRAECPQCKTAADLADIRRIYAKRVLQLFVTKKQEGLLRLFAHEQSEKNMLRIEMARLKQEQTKLMREQAKLTNLVNQAKAELDAKQKKLEMSEFSRSRTMSYCVINDKLFIAHCCNFVRGIEVDILDAATMQQQPWMHVNNPYMYVGRMIYSFAIQPLGPKLRLYDLNPSPTAFRNLIHAHSGTSNAMVLTQSMRAAGNRMICALQPDGNYASSVMAMGKVGISQQFQIGGILLWQTPSPWFYSGNSTEGGMVLMVKPSVLLNSLNDSTYLFICNANRSNTVILVNGRSECNRCLAEFQHVASFESGLTLSIMVRCAQCLSNGHPYAVGYVNGRKIVAYVEGRKKLGLQRFINIVLLHDTTLLTND